MRGNEPAVVKRTLSGFSKPRRPTCVGGCTTDPSNFKSAVLSRSMTSQKGFRKQSSEGRRERPSSFRQEPARVRNHRRTSAGLQLHSGHREERQLTEKRTESQCTLDVQQSRWFPGDRQSDRQRSDGRFPGTHELDHHRSLTNECEILLFILQPVKWHCVSQTSTIRGKTTESIATESRVKQL